MLEYLVCSSSKDKFKLCITSKWWIKLWEIYFPRKGYFASLLWTHLLRTINIREIKNKKKKPKPLSTNCSCGAERTQHCPCCKQVCQRLRRDSQLRWKPGSVVQWPNATVTITARPKWFCPFILCDVLLGSVYRSAQTSASFCYLSKEALVKAAKAIACRALLAEHPSEWSNSLWGWRNHTEVQSELGIIWSEA